MGVFRYPVEIGDPTGTRFERVDALVDTGAQFSAFPASQLQRLGVMPIGRRRLLIASGEWIERDLGQTWIRVDGQAFINPVIFSDEELGGVLGAVTLESFSLAVDPNTKRLIPIDALFLVSPLMVRES